MSYTPPGYPGQPQQPASPDGRWWWDGSQWRPNQAHPFDGPEPALDNPRQPASVAEGVRFTPGPPGVPNPYVPPHRSRSVPRLADPTRPGATPTLDDLVLLPPERSWWTPRRFVIVVAGVVLAVLVGIAVLFWLSIDAFQRQRDQPPAQPPTDTPAVVLSLGYSSTDPLARSADTSA